MTLSRLCLSKWTVTFSNMALRATQTAALARRVEQAMEAAGLTPYKLAERAIMPRTTLLHCLAGSMDFKLEQLYRISEVLGFSPAEMLAEIEAEETAA